MNTAQRQLLLFGSLMTVLLAPYFNPLLEAMSQGIQAIESRLDRSQKVETPEDRLRVFCPRTSIKKPFVVFVYVRLSERARTVTLVLPDGLTLEPGQQAEQFLVPTGPDGYARLTWRILASECGEFVVRAKAPGIAPAAERIWVGGRLICAFG